MNTKAKIHLIYLLATPGGASARTNWSPFLSACKKWLMSPEDIKILVLDVTEDFLMSDNDNIIGQVNLDEEKLSMIIAEFASLI